MGNGSENRVIFYTYSEVFSDFEDYVENADYDSELIQFSVPVNWAVDYIFIHFRMGIEDFMNGYDFDDTLEMMECAEAEGIDVQQKIISIYEEEE